MGPILGNPQICILRQGLCQWQYLCLMGGNSPSGQGLAGFAEKGRFATNKLEQCILGRGRHFHIEMADVLRPHLG